jgi:hypothetical protein
MQDIFFVTKKKTVVDLAYSRSLGKGLAHSKGELSSCPWLSISTERIDTTVNGCII